MSDNKTPEKDGTENGLGFFARLKFGLSRSKIALSDGIGGIFNMRKLDDETLEELEELLITSDIGVQVAAAVANQLRQTRYNKEITPDEVREALAEEVTKILRPVAVPLTIDPTHKPHVILMVGVNGTGKTTTIGKLAHRLQAEGKSVMLAAGDTFRAAAIEQLQIWGARTNCPVVSSKVGADPAGLAFDALDRARADNIDVLLVDTAGRLQNKTNLMAELEKVVRVLRKLDPDAPHTTLLVLDATTGQNALNQVEVFQEVAEVSGLVMTKLDGTARGGILVAIARRFGLPIHAIGVGEGVADMQPFDADGFAHALADVEIPGGST